MTRDKIVEKVIKGLQEMYDISENPFNIKVDLMDLKKFNQNLLKENKKIIPIPYDLFYLDEDTFKEIVKKAAKYCRNKIDKESIAINIYLGPSPTSSEELYRHNCEILEQYYKSPEIYDTLTDRQKMVIDDTKIFIREYILKSQVYGGDFKYKCI